MTGETLREARQRRGLTQQELAARVGLPQGQISELETETRSIGRLRWDMIQRLVLVLELDFAALCTPQTLPTVQAPVEPQPRLRYRY